MSRRNRLDLLRSLFATSLGRRHSLLQRPAWGEGEPRGLGQGRRAWRAWAGAGRWVLGGAVSAGLAGREDALAPRGAGAEPRAQRETAHPARRTRHPRQPPERRPSRSRHCARSGRRVPPLPRSAAGYTERGDVLSRLSHRRLGAPPRPLPPGGV